jgi:toxin CcdB
MARFDVFTLVGGEGFLLDVQSDLLDQLASRVVVPLLPVESTPAPVRRLNPVFEIGGRKYLMATQLLSAVPMKDLAKHHRSLSEHEDQILGALDMLVRGF